MTQATSMRRVGIIMAGGSGERFWPVSRRMRPKQLLNLTNQDQCMLAEAVARIEPLIPPQDVFVVTGEHLVAPIREAQVGVPDENVIAEPCKRNTAGALAYATAHVLAQGGGDADAVSMAVLTADHIIGEPDKFRTTVAAALAAAEQADALATLGVTPTRPETGYGYIQAQADTARACGSGITMYTVSAFHEKPNRERAEDFLASGTYYWNSGMFFWKASTFLRELDAASPAHAEATRAMAAALRTRNGATVKAVFEALENTSIDYELMEHAKHVLVVRADFDWDDVGAWSSLERTYPGDERGNVAAGNPILLDTEGCIVYNDVDGADMAVAAIGVEDLVVVVTRDAVLVVPKERAQDVRHAVEELRKRNARQV